MKIYPYKKKGGGDTKSVEVVLTQELEDLAILMRGVAKCFHPLKGGMQKVLIYLDGIL